MSKFRITKRDLTFLAIGSIAIIIFAFYVNRKENKITGTGQEDNSPEGEVNT